MPTLRKLTPEAYRKLQETQALQDVLEEVADEQDFPRKANLKPPPRPDGRTPRRAGQIDPPKSKA